MENDKNLNMEEEQGKKHKSESYKLETSKLNWRDGLSVFEAKMSVLLISAVITFVFSLAMYYFRLDISNNLTSIVETYILCIAGITTAEHAIEILKDKGIFGNNNKK